MSEKRPVPLSEDALNRFRITHSDKEIRPLLRRIHRFPHLASLPLGPNAVNDEGTSTGHTTEEIARERDMIQMELLKWRAGVERVMGSVRNLERQRSTYLRRASETENETEALQTSLIADQALLELKKRERDHLIQCDEVATRITSRGKTRAELDEAIAELQTSLVEHRASHGLYLQTAQARIDAFSQIAKLVEDVRAHKLPLDPQASIEEAAAGGSDQTEKMEVDESAASASAGKLNAQALPFQPAPPPSAPASRSGTPPTSSAHVASSSRSASSNTLPSRPARAAASASTSSVPQKPATAVNRQVSSTLPTRPSALRSVTRPAGRGAGLEEGEVGGEAEDGEVSEDHGKRRAGEDGRSSSRSTRSKR